MDPAEPLLKIRRDRFEVLQGSSYVAIDRSRVDAIHFHAGVLTVHFRERGQVKLDCGKATTTDLKGLLHALETQRDRNHESARQEARSTSSAILPGFFF